MCNLKLKQSVNKKSIKLTFLIVCSLFISENALAHYDKNDCAVSSSNVFKYIDIFFKFFEYQTEQGGKCSYIKDFEILYSTDNGVNHEHLMTARTEEQTSNTWAWIECKNKKFNEKINLYLNPRDRRTNSGAPQTWKNETIRRFDVISATSSNVIEFGVHWYPNCKVTDIQIKLKWYNYMLKKTEDITLDYKVFLRSYLKCQNWSSKNSNFSNSSPKQEICTEENNKSVKASKEANAIVVEGALNENIQVYTTTGALVKSVVADCDVLQIPVPANQLYVVKVGQGRYKVAL